MDSASRSENMNQSRDIFDLTACGPHDILHIREQCVWSRYTEVREFYLHNIIKEIHQDL